MDSIDTFFLEHHSTKTYPEVYLVYYSNVKVLKEVSGKVVIKRKDTLKLFLGDYGF